MGCSPTRTAQTPPNPPDKNDLTPPRESACFSFGADAEDDEDEDERDIGSTAGSSVDLGKPSAGFVEVGVPCVVCAQ